MSAKRKTVSEREFAAMIGMSQGAVQRRRAAGLLPKSARLDARGRWRIDPDLGRQEWLAQGVDMRLRGKDANREWREARTRREAAKAAAAEMELARLRGELVRASEVETGWASLVMAARGKLLGIPTRLRQRRPHLAPADVAEVDGLIREALEELSEGKSA